MNQTREDEALIAEWMGWVWYRIYNAHVLCDKEYAEQFGRENHRLENTDIVQENMLSAVPSYSTDANALLSVMDELMNRSFDAECTLFRGGKDDIGVDLEVRDVRQQGHGATSKEALFNACVAAVKRILELCDGDMDAAREWGKL